MLSELEKAIKLRAREFEPSTLVALLRSRLPEREIRYRSNPSCALCPTAVHEVEFEPGRVTVILNIGLLSSSSPLPSYFLELFTAPRVGPGLLSLIAVLDDRLLSERIESLSPERSARLLGDARRARRAILRMSAPTSSATLHRLVSALFPELAVSVRRLPLDREMPIEPPRLGFSALGASALGGAAHVPVPGFDIILDSSETTTWNGGPWVHEARTRIDEHLFPVLADTRVHLRVILIDRESKGRLVLKTESALGFEPLERAQMPQITLLFDGPVPAARKEERRELP